MESKIRRHGKKQEFRLPGYDVEETSRKAKEAPKWAHFGIGNIFRVFIGGIADGLMEEGIWIRGLPVSRHLIMMW